MSGPPPVIGDPEQAVSVAIADALPAFESWQESIASTIASASSLEDAKRRLGAWQTAHARDEAISSRIFESVATANMAGQLAMRLVEVNDAGKRALAADGGTGGPSPFRPQIRGFFGLTFKEALDEFLRRGVVSPDEWQRMSDEARQRAFTATLLSSEALRDTAYFELARSLEEGGTFADFARELRTQERSLGVTAADPAYLETVFRTNLSTAYTAGRIHQMSSPEVLAAHPYVQYRAIIDGRTTSVCRYLDGLTFDRRTDPGWARFAPPNHFNCRSQIVTLPASRVSPSQVVRSDSIDSRGQPAPGFDSPPSLALDA